MTLKQIRSRVVVGAKITCVENSYQPKLNGSTRVVEKAQRNCYYYRRADGVRVSGALPERARDILTSTDDTITFRLFPRDPASTHTITIQFERTAEGDQA